MKQETTIISTIILSRDFERFLFTFDCFSNNYSSYNEWYELSYPTFLALLKEINEYMKEDFYKLWDWVNAGNMTKQDVIHAVQELTSLQHPPNTDIVRIVTE